MKTIVGEPIPLILQLFDGRDDVKPVAVGFDDSGKNFFEVSLVHFGGGLYLDKTIPMPKGTSFVIVQYHVRDRKGRPVDDYEIVNDTVYAVQPEKAPEKFAFGHVVEEKQEGITGYVCDEIEGF